MLTAFSCYRLLPIWLYYDRCDDRRSSVPFVFVYHTNNNNIHETFSVIRIVVISFAWYKLVKRYKIKTIRVVMLSIRTISLKSFIVKIKIN